MLEKLKNLTAAADNLFKKAAAAVRAAWATMTAWAARQIAAAAETVKNVAESVRRNKKVVITATALIIVAAIALAGLLPHTYFDKEGFLQMVNKITSEITAAGATVQNRIIERWNTIRPAATDPVTAVTVEAEARVEVKAA